MNIEAANKKPETEKPEPENPDAPLVPASDNQIASVGESASLTGEWGVDDAVIPYLSIVGKTSEMVEEFGGGSIVFDKSVKLSKAGADHGVHVVFLHAKKSYEQNLPFEAEERPKRWSRKEDVEADGFRVEYGKDPQTATTVAEMTVLVPVGEEEGEICVDGKYYARALFTCRNTSYAVAKKIITATVRREDKQMHRIGWRLWTVEKNAGPKVKYFSPAVERSDPPSEALIEAIERELI